MSLAGCQNTTDPDSAPLATKKQAKNLVAEKTASAGGSVTAHPGGRITYTIAITNNNQKAVSVNVTDTLPENTSLVAGCDTVEDNTLSWTVKKIEPGQTATVSYTVKPNYTIKQVREAKEDIILKNTPAKVMDIEVAAPAKDIYVLETFNKEDIRKLEMAIDSLVTANLTAKNSSNNPVSQISLASMMYNVAFTVSTGLGTTDPDEVFTLIFEKAGQEGADNASGGVEDVVDTATNLLDRVPPHLYGGTAIPATKDSLFRGDRATEVTIADLITGDLLFVNRSGETKLYIVDGDKLVHLGATEVTRSIDPATVLPDLPTSEKFVVVRPSINLNITFSLNEDESFNDADKEGYTDLEKALIATAETYLLRGDRAQYTDDMTGKGVYRWESGVRQPEDYTVDQYGYTNCAAFTYDVHWTTYGVAPKASYNGSKVTLNTTKNLANSASVGWDAETLTGNNESTVFYYVPPVDANAVSTLTDAEKEDLKQQICSLLRPGDIICIRRHTGTGHAMLYVGNGTIIHSSGSNYSNANKTDTHEATVRFRMVEDLFDPEIYNETSCVYNLASFSIVRPQNNTEAAITENAANRVNNMQGIIAEKVSSTAMGKTVNCGDTITYTFHIFNTTAEEKAVAIRDELSQYCTFESATDSGNCSEGQIAWDIAVPADTRVSVSYTVKVNEGLAAYTKIDGSKATVNGVVHKCYDTVVANTLTAEEQNKIVEAVNTVKEMDVSGLTAPEIASLIYETAFGTENIFGDQVKTYADLLNGSGMPHIGIFLDSSNYSDASILTMADLNNAPAAKMVAPGLFGGQNVYTSANSSNPFYRYLGLSDSTLRSRYYWEKDLVVGDLFLMQGTSQESLYIYVGNDTFVSLGEGHTLFSEQSVSARFGYAPATVWKYHAVLRPSFVLDI